MRLIEIYKGLLREAEAEFTPSLDPTNPNLIEFHNDNFVASLVPTEKRVEFSPIDDGKASNRVRSMINNLRTQFRVQKVTQLAMNTFDVQFDATENWDNIQSFITDNAAEAPTEEMPDETPVDAPTP